MSDKTISTDRGSAFKEAAIEIAFIVFLFYSNLLMGEDTGRHGQDLNLLTAMVEIVTYRNFAIAIVTAILGHAGFEYLRRHGGSGRRG